ncbi:MAG: GNAT family N-acetyltransferase [Actinomycetales bacterium]
MSASEQMERLGLRLLGRRRPHVRTLTDHDRNDLLALCRRDPVTNVFVMERALSPVPLSQGGQLWGWFEEAQLVSACWSGANFVLVEPTPAAVEAFAGRARTEGRRCMSIFGAAEPTLALWGLLEPHWKAPREIRPDQPVMVLDGPPAIPPDPGVRVAVPDDLDMLVPACVAMFTEEVGYSPVSGDGGWSYRARIEYLVRSGRSFLRVDEFGNVIFKAELGAISDTVAQVQGVYVHPQVRGRGLAAPGMAAVAELAQAQVPVISLYVNEFNTPAVAAYRRAGFRQVGTFATVLF